MEGTDIFRSTSATLNGLHQSGAPWSGKACDSCVGKQAEMRRVEEMRGKVFVPSAPTILEGQH